MLGCRHFEPYVGIRYCHGHVWPGLSEPHLLIMEIESRVNRSTINNCHDNSQLYFNIKSTLHPPVIILNITHFHFL